MYSLMAPSLACLQKPVTHRCTSWVGAQAAHHSGSLGHAPGMLEGCADTQLQHAQWTGVLGKCTHKTLFYQRTGPKLFQGAVPAATERAQDA